MERDQLKLFYTRMIERSAGVFAMKHIESGRRLILGSDGIEQLYNRIMFELKQRSYKNPRLQFDFDQCGEGGFICEMLEKIDRKDTPEDYLDGGIDFNDAQQQLLEDARKRALSWIEQLKPYGERGYHTPKRMKKPAEERKSIPSPPGALLWESSIDQLKGGYALRGKCYTCLGCGVQFEQGEIYPVGGRFFDARRRMEEHIKTEHIDPFNILINIDQRYLSLSEIQQQVLIDLYRGLDDREIAKKRNTTQSTIRNHRFRLKEKGKQAKILFALMEIAGERSDQKLVEVHPGATMVDERYAVTEVEQQKILKKYLKGDQLKQFPRREREKIVLLREMVKRFKSGEIYSEQEINSVLKSFYEDYVTLRRYMIEYGIMKRSDDCRQYWIG